MKYVTETHRSRSSNVDNTINACVKSNNEQFSNFSIRLKSFVRIFPSEKIVMNRMYIPRRIDYRYRRKRQTLNDTKQSQQTTAVNCSGGGDRNVISFNGKIK